MNRLQKGIRSGSPLFIVLVYLLVGFLWIHLSDQWVLSMVDSAEVISEIQTYKGWIFVSVSALLIYLLVHSNNRVLGATIRRLTQSQHEYEATFEDVAVGIAHHRPDGEWIRVNRALCEMLEYSEEELLQLKFEDLIHPDHLETARMLDRNLAEAVQSKYQTERRFKRKNGTYMTSLVTKNAIFDTDGSLDYIIAVLEDISRRKMAEKQIKRSLREKEVLLAEIHHRVKNNLALVSALLELQSAYTENRAALEILHDSRMRIKCLSMIYETFSGSESAEMNFDEYLQQWIQKISGLDEDKIELRMHINPVKININQAVPCGLICSELLMNAQMHAFEGVDRPVIDVTLVEVNDWVYLTVADNGKGMDREIDLHKPETLGFTIIKSLTAQMNATLNIDTRHGTATGTVFHLSFKKESGKGPSSALKSANEGLI